MNNPLQAKTSIILLFLFAGGFRGAGQVKPASQNHITVDAANVRNSIPPTLFGTCMEDVNHEIYGGIYAQLIMGESFEEPASGVNYNEWKKYGGYWAADREYGDSGVTIIPGRHTRRMVGTTELDVEPDGSARLLYDKRDARDGDMGADKRDKSPEADECVGADMRFLQTRGTGAGILLRVTDIGIGNNTLVGYEVRLNRETNQLQLIKHRNDERLLANAPVTFSPDGWHRIKARLREGQISVYFNDSLAISYNDGEDPIRSGRIGLATSGAPAAFRNVYLTQDGLERKLALTRPAAQQVSDRWDAISSGADDVQFGLVQHDAVNGLTMQTIELTGSGGKAGVANRGLNRWGISVKQGLLYTGSCYLKTPVSELAVTMALESADGSRTYGQQVITVSGNTWKEYRFSLVAGTSDTNARFALYFRQRGKLCVDQISLLPPPTTLYKDLPMRADIGNALVAEGVTFMRYAGTMVNSAGYRFKKMIGPRASRPPYTGHWNEFSTNGYGIEDFLQFCEASHITPAFAINIEEMPQDAADMVDYLNGDEKMVWGQKRIRNGHPKPYGIRYIEIGNEEILFEGDDEKASDHYIERFLSLYRAIHARDTAIQLVCSAWWRPGSSNTQKIFAALDGKAAYWDYHVEGDNAASGTGVDKALTRMEALWHTWNPSTTMRCAIFEENGGLHNMQRALGHATNLNAVRRHGDFVLTSCPANALQPWHQNDNDWDQGQIFFTPDSVWCMPPYYVQQMAAANYLPLRVQDSVEGGLDVTATRDKEGKTLVLHLVNTSATPAEATIHIGHFASRTARVHSLAGSLSAENRPGNTRHVVPLEQTIRPDAKGDWHYTCSPWSYTIIRL